MMQTFREDLISAFRQMRRAKGVAIAVILMIGVGIGANTAIFGLLKATFADPPFPEMERLVRVRTVSPEGESLPWISIPEYLTIEERSRSFAAVSAMDDSVLTLGPDAQPAERLTGQRFKAGMLQVLGVQPQLGRGFAAGEDRPGGLVPLAIISDALWRNRFGADPGIVNGTMLLDNVSTTIVGVMPSGFSLFTDADVWIPQTFNPAQLQGSTRFLTMVARLQRGTSVEQAQAEMDGLARSMGEEHPDRNAGWGIRLEPLDTAYFGDTRRALFILQAAVALLLLIACANVAGLLLVRASARRQEVSMRRALGAGRLRLLRQFLAEGLALALAGGILGIVLAWAGTRLLTGLRPAWLARIDDVGVDAPFLLFAIAASVVTGVAFGLAPALQWPHARASATVYELARTIPGGRRRMRAQGVLVIGQVALTLVLLVGAGLMIKSFMRLQSADLGADPTGVLSFESVLSRQLYLKMTGSRINGFGEFDFSPAPAQLFERIAQRVQEIPGVVSAAGTGIAPFRGAMEAPFRIDGRPTPDGSSLTAGYHLVTPDFFDTMRIPIVRGRDFTYQDRPDGPWVAIVNEAMARRYWPDSDPIGQFITLDIVPDERPREVIAVVGDTPPTRWEQAPVPALYLPHVQQLLRYRAPYGGVRLQMTFVMRITQPPDTIVPAVRRAVAEVDPAAPVAQVQMLEEFLAREVDTPRFYMIFLTLFGTFAALLAAFGIYGVIAYSVAQRAREIAVRSAIGAGPRSVVRLVLGQAVALTATGIALGVGASLLVTRYLASVLWDVTPTDTATFVNVSVLFATVAVLAGLVPTLRALRLEPRAVLAEM